MLEFVLIITTFYTPHVDVEVQEIPMVSEEACIETIAKYEEAWAERDEEFHYVMRCENRHPDGEKVEVWRKRSEK